MKRPQHVKRSAFPVGLAKSSFGNVTVTSAETVFSDSAAPSSSSISTHTSYGEGTLSLSQLNAPNWSGSDLRGQKSSRVHVEVSGRRRTKSMFCLPWRFGINNFHSSNLCLILDYFVIFHTLKCVFKHFNQVTCSNVVQMSSYTPIQSQELNCQVFFFKLNYLVSITLCHCMCFHGEANT